MHEQDQDQDLDQILILILFLFKSHRPEQDQDHRHDQDQDLDQILILVLFLPASPHPPSSSPSPLPSLQAPYRQVEVQLRQGRHHQIRRLCQRAGLRLLHLRRLSVGPIELGGMTPGEAREQGQSAQARSSPRTCPREHPPL